MGIRLESNDSVNVYNNYIHTEGNLMVYGVFVNNCSHTGIWFNSIDVTNTDIAQDSRALMLYNSGANNEIKNNIFNITQGGYPVFCSGTPIPAILDYNNYYSPTGLIGQYNNINYYSLEEWGNAIYGDANSKDVNPYFASVENPLPYQRELNGAGIPVKNILFDINGKIRNDQAPDMGCIEFTVDFGVTDLISPTLECFHTDLENVTVYLRQFGDIPFKDLKLAYQVNYGTIHYDTIYGTIYNDLVYTFSTKVNISQTGEYFFKVWLINTLDDNSNNDTLKAYRYSKPPPIITALQAENHCTGPSYRFRGEATVAAPYYIDHYEWDFGDSTYSVLQNPAHVYTASGTFNVVLKAYSNAGCFNSDTITVVSDTSYRQLTMSVDVTDVVCKGDSSGSVTISATGGTRPYFYFFGDQQLTSNVVTNLPAGNYQFSVRDSEECIDGGTAVISPTIILDPVIIASADTGYAPLEVTLDFQCPNAASWKWYFDDQTSSTDHITNKVFNTFGNHPVILEVNSGAPAYCTDTTRFNVFILPVYIQATNIVFSDVQTNQFTFNWTDGNGIRRAAFIKQVSDGSASPSNSIDYVPNTVFGSGTQIGNSGWFCVFNGTFHDRGVTVTNVQPKTDYRVMVCEWGGITGQEIFNTRDTTGNPRTLSTVFVWIETNDVFTPNNDGFNDFFEIRSEWVTSMHVEIFDRWGVRVFQINEVNGKWDGKTSSGQDAPDGVYYFYLTATGADGQEYRLSGSITLIREGVNIYPNPAGKEIKVSVTSHSVGSATIEIYTVTGELLLSEKTEAAGEITVPVGFLRKGLYNLRVCTQDGCQTRRFVKN